jgi:hypothetical protein
MVRRLAQIAAAADSPISAEDRMGLLTDCFGLSEAGHYSPSVPLDFVSCLIHETEAWVLLIMKNFLAHRLTTWGFGSNLAESGIKALLRRLFVQPAEQLGFESKTEDSVMDPLRRRAAISGAVMGEELRLARTLVLYACCAKPSLGSVLEELMRRFDLFKNTGNLEAIPADLKSKFSFEPFITIWATHTLGVALTGLAFTKVWD